MGEGVRVAIEETGVSVGVGEDGSAVRVIGPGDVDPQARAMNSKASVASGVSILLIVPLFSDPAACSRPADGTGDKIGDVEIREPPSIPGWVG